MKTLEQRVSAMEDVLAEVISMLYRLQSSHGILWTSEMKRLGTQGFGGLDLSPEHLAVVGMHALKTGMRANDALTAINAAKEGGMQ